MMCGADMPTLLLSRTHVERLLDPSALVTQLRAGFITYSNSSTGRALRVRAPIPDYRGTVTVLFPGMLPGLGVGTVRIIAVLTLSLSLAAGTLTAQGPKITSLLSRDLAGLRERNSR